MKSAAGRVAWRWHTGVQTTALRKRQVPPNVQPVRAADQHPGRDACLIASVPEQPAEFPIVAQSAAGVTTRVSVDSGGT